jgi:hypothetical protein
MHVNIIKEIQELINTKIISILDNEGTLAAFSELYTMFPDQFQSAIPRQTFMNFCFANQKLIFSDMNRNSNTHNERINETTTIKIIRMV